MISHATPETDTVVGNGNFFRRWENGLSARSGGQGVELRGRNIDCD